MRRYRFAWPGLLLALMMIGCVTPRVHAKSERAADYLPDGLALAVSVRSGDRQIEALRATLAARDFFGSAAIQALLENPDLIQARVGLTGIAAISGMDLWEASGVVLGRDLMAGVRPGKDGKPEVLLVTVARHPEGLDRILGSIHGLVGLSRDDSPAAQRTWTVDGVRVHSAAPQVMHCRVDDALLVSNSRDLLKAAIAARDAGPLINRSKAYREALESVPLDAPVWAYADVATIRRRIGALPERLPNPAAGFVAGGAWHAIRHADAAVAWLEADGADLALKVRVASKAPLPGSHRGFIVKEVAPAKWSAEALPRFLAEVSVARGWADLFADREALLTLPASSDVVNFNSVLTTLLGQVDFMDEILPVVNGPVRLVATRRTFAGSDFVPSPKLPAFALITPLSGRTETNFARRLQSGTLTAFSLLSADAAQKKEAGFFVDTDRYRGHKIYYTEFNTPSSGGMRMDAPARTSTDAADGAGPDADGSETTVAGVRYNFAPAAALVDDQYVVATSRQMLRDVIDAIAASAGAGIADLPRGADRLRINVVEVVETLLQNRQELVVNSMLEKDHSKRDAEREVDALLGALRFLDFVELTSWLDEHGARADLRVRLRSVRDARTGTTSTGRTGDD